MLIATDGDGDTGKAGGYAGELLGVQIQNSNSYNFAHIIGREVPVDMLEPWSRGVRQMWYGLSALGGLIKADILLGVLQGILFLCIKNSETTCVPCGGAVRAQAESV